MDEQQEQPAFERKFRAEEGTKVIAFGSRDGTTHKLEPDSRGVVTATSSEEAEHLESLGLKEPRQKPTESATSAAAKAEKEA